jgi:hypothetical protein
MKVNKIFITLLRLVFIGMKEKVVWGAKNILLHPKYNLNKTHC